MGSNSDTGALPPAVKTRQVKTPENKYVQIDSCWVNCFVGPDSASDTKEGPADRGIT